jgi:hypothetical protein
MRLETHMTPLMTSPDTDRTLLDYGPVMVTMPYELPTEMLRAVRRDPLTSCEDKDEMNKRIGWLLCAWEVMVRANGNADAP